MGTHFCGINSGHIIKDQLRNGLTLFIWILGNWLKKNWKIELKKKIAFQIRESDTW